MAAALCLAAHAAFGLQTAGVWWGAEQRRAPAPRLQFEEDTDFDTSVLQSRIEALRNGPADEAALLLVLDSMVPRQQLTFAAPGPLVSVLRRSADDPLVMVGLHRHAMMRHGVIVTADEIGEPLNERGDASVTLRAAADALVEVTELGRSDGTAVGLPGRVRRVDLDDGAAADIPPALLERSEGLAPLTDEWSALVRAGRERSPGQLDAILQSLGPMPPADAPSARALWIAALINPLPALGVALEVRPACLVARTAEKRVTVTEAALLDSINRLRRPGPPF